MSPISVFFLKAFLNFFKPSLNDSFFQLRTDFNWLLMNLVVGELLVSMIGIPIDLVAAGQLGWKMGRGFCIFTGFILTFLGKHTVWCITNLFRKVHWYSRFQVFHFTLSLQEMTALNHKIFSRNEFSSISRSHLHLQTSCSYTTGGVTKYLLTWRIKIFSS